MPGIATAGNDADVYVVANPSLVIADEPCDNIDSGAWKVYATHTHDYWDKLHPIVIEESVNGTTGWATVAASAYTFQYVGGIVTFAVARTNHFIRVHSGYYWLISQCGDCHTWALTLKSDVADTTTFQSQWHLRTATVKSGTAKIASFRVDDLLFKELGNLLILVLYSDKSANTRWEAYAYAEQIDPKNVFAGVIEQDMSFVVEADCFFYAS